MSNSGFPEDVYFYIKSMMNGSVLDVYDGRTEKETKIIIYEQKQSDNDNQLWSFKDGYLTNKKSGLVIDIKGGDLKSESQIIQYDAKATQAHNQRWGFRDGYVYVRADPRLVLDVKGRKDDDGTKVIIYPRKVDGDNANQQWIIEPFGGDNY